MEDDASSAIAITPTELRDGVGLFALPEGGPVRVVIEDFDVDASGSERTYDVLEVEASGETRRAEDARGILDLVAEIESDGRGETDAVVSGDDLALVLDGGSVVLRGVVDEIGASRLEAAGVDADTPGSGLFDDAAPPPAEPIAEPPDAAAAAVDFERHAAGAEYDRTLQDLDWNAEGYNDEWMTGHAFVSDAEARSGSQSLRIDYDSEVRTGLDVAALLPEEREYYLSYWVKFEDDFSFDGRTKDGGKLPGLAGGGGAPGGGEVPTGDNGYSARYMWGTDGRAELYLYHMDQPGTYGEGFLFEAPDGGDVHFETGRWHHLVQRVKINDGDQANGEIDVWMDGDQVLDLDGIRMVTNGRGIDQAMLQSFHGGSDREWFPETDQSAYFDDFTITTDPGDLGFP